MKGRVRGMIEARAAQWWRTHPEVCDFLSERLAEMRLALDAGDDDRLAAAALRFHRRLVEASGNRTFLHTGKLPLGCARTSHVAADRGTHGDIGQAYATHLAIVEHLRAGDGAGAAEASGTTSSSS